MYECLSAAYYIIITKEPILYINDHKVYCLFNVFFFGGSLIMVYLGGKGMFKITKYYLFSYTENEEKTFIIVTDVKVAKKNPANI